MRPEMYALKSRLDKGKHYRLKNSVIRENLEYTITQRSSSGNCTLVVKIPYGTKIITVINSGYMVEVKFDKDIQTRWNTSYSKRTSWYSVSSLSGADCSTEILQIIMKELLPEFDANEEMKKVKLRTNLIKKIHDIDNLKLLNQIDELIKKYEKWFLNK